MVILKAKFSSIDIMFAYIFNCMVMLDTKWKRMVQKYGYQLGIKIRIEEVPEKLKTNLKTILHNKLDILVS